MAFRDDDLGEYKGIVLRSSGNADQVDVHKVQGKQAHARQVPQNTQSKKAVPGQVPVISGPTSEAQRLEVEGTSEDIWKRCVEFCNSLENTDLEIQDSSYKVKGHNFQLPRYTVFRLQLFQNDEKTTPFVVELQRREGDAYLHGQIFQGLKSEFEEAPEMSVKASTPNVESDVKEKVADMSSLNLTNSPDDVLQWITFLNSKDLEACRSGSTTLALAAQNVDNFEILMKHASKILEGIQLVLPSTEDPATAHGCCAFLSAVSEQDDWMKLCSEINLTAQLAEAALLWSGQSNKKNLHPSPTILRLIVKTLTPLKTSLEQAEKEKLLIASKNVNISVDKLLE